LEKGAKISMERPQSKVSKGIKKALERLEQIEDDLE
tara:strand:+ start:828 stop:935 length:108 start_codon:yes stop_codon:yes gene_type:complete